MYLRCTTCHEAIWVRPTGNGAAELASCERCGQEYQFEIAGNFDAVSSDLSRRAGAFAQENGVDLPSAYSVLLGIATLDAVMELQAAGSRTGRRKRVATETDATTARFDPAFRPAVEAGLLTAREAYLRGKRHAYATRVAGRHHLPMEMAEAVADNRISLLEALREREPRPRVTIRIGSRNGVSAGAILIATGALLALTVAGLHIGARDEQRRPGRSRVLVGTAEILTDDEGRVVRVSGTSPDDVLETYCSRAPSERGLEPFGVVPGSVDAAVRIGVLRDPGEPAGLLAIPIRADPTTGRWFTGDGRRPLVPNSAPPGAADALNTNP